MESEPNQRSGPRPPDLTLVMPCFNEEQVVDYTIPRLVEAFAASEYGLEIVAVDNGSTDQTAAKLAELSARFGNVVPHHVDINIGYGNGLLQGIPKASGTWVGFIPADGQVDAEDVVRLFDAVASTGTDVLGKVRRRFRMDGLRRKLVSIAYNGFIRLLWPRLGSIDVNGTPKILPRSVLERMRLESTDWFLDPEILIKAYYLGVPVLELNVFARVRSLGLSHVRMTTCWEFFQNLLSYRFGNRLASWKRQAAA